MPGTLVQDALAAVIYNANITSATTTTGSAVEVGAPRLVSIVHNPGTLTGDHTFDIEIQGSDASGFGAGTVVSYGRFEGGTEDQVANAALVTYVSKRYVRAVIVTAGTVTASNHHISLAEPHLLRTSTYPSATQL